MQNEFQAKIQFDYFNSKPNWKEKAGTVSKYSKCFDTVLSRSKTPLKRDKDFFQSKNVFKMRFP